MYVSCNVKEMFKSFSDLFKVLHLIFKKKILASKWGGIYDDRIQSFDMWGGIYYDEI